MKFTAFLGKGLLTAGVAAAGLSTGNWARETVHSSPLRVQQASFVPQASTPAVPDAMIPATQDSLLHYKFVPGERTYYRLQADISGAGIESLAGSSGVAMGLGVDPMLLAVPVALSATCAFMLPVATPPNAIAYGSGYVTIGQMVKGGVILILIGT